MIAKPEVNAFKIVKDNEIVAFGRYSFPYTPTTEEKEEQGAEKAAQKKAKEDGIPDSSWPSGTNLELVEEKFRGLDVMREKYVDPEKDYGMCFPFFAYPKNQGNKEDGKGKEVEGMRMKLTKKIVCSLLAVHPGHQRKGLGKMLLKHVLDMADAEGRRVYIEATDAGFPVSSRPPALVKKLFKRNTC